MAGVIYWQPEFPKSFLIYALDDMLRKHKDGLEPVCFCRLFVSVLFACRSLTL